MTVIEDSLREHRGLGPIPPRLPRVAFVLSQFPETHETFILREFVALEREGLDFVILSLKPCRDKVVQTDARRLVARTVYPSDAPVCPFSVRKLMRTYTELRPALPWKRSPVKTSYVAWAAARLASLCRTLGVGHIHAHWATAPTSAAVIMSSLLEIPFSFTAHAWDIFAGDGRLSQKARLAEFIVTCTGANVRAIRGMVADGEREKVVLNYHGVPDACGHEALPFSCPGPMKITAAGRLVETKGFCHLFDALKVAPFPFELTLIGGGPLDRSLRRKAARLGGNGSVRFTGTIPNEDVFSILESSDCFVMPSVIASNGDRDGIPNVLLEAMSIALPVVASGISGIPEAVLDGRTGFLVPPGDPQALCDALARLGGGPDAARQMGALGREHVTATFSAADNARSLFRLFKARLEASRR